MKERSPSLNVLILFSILAVSVLLTFISGNGAFLTRSERYETVPSNGGNFVFLKHQLFTETSDIDVAFIGSSQVWQGIAAKKIESELSVKLGRPAKVLVLACNWSGPDVIYTILNDLLSHRRVKLVMLQIPHAGLGGPHYTLRWIGHNFRDKNIETNPAAQYFSRYDKMQLFAADMLGMPWIIQRTLLPQKSHLSSYGWSIDPNGSLPVASTMVGTPVQPNLAATLPKLHSDTDFVLERKDFNFYQAEISTYLAAYLKGIRDVTSHYKTRLAFFEIPRFDQKTECAVPFGHEISQIFSQEEYTFIGMPACQFFKSLPEFDWRQFYADTFHMNKEGMTYFADILIPSIQKIVGGAHE